MLLGWLSDCHLNMLENESRNKFFNYLKVHFCDAYIISGDIGDGYNTPSYLIELVQVIQRPIYFCLGNHDYYHSSVRTVHDQIKNVTANNNRLFWLRSCGVIALDNENALVGVDGWADGRYAPIDTTKFNVNDNNYIYDLRIAKHNDTLIDTMRYFADIDAIILQDSLLKAVKQNYKNIYIITHVPPYSIFYDKSQNLQSRIPFYSSKALGDVCLAIAKQNPEINFRIYSGHTHIQSKMNILDNLTLNTAFSRYGDPKVIDDITIPGGAR